MALDLIVRHTPLNLLLKLIDAFQSRGEKRKYEEFVDCIKKNIDSVLNDLAGFDKKLAHSARKARGDIIIAIETAIIFMDTVDDFFDYGKGTDFESIKEDIKNRNATKIEAFFSKMDKWLENVNDSYQNFEKQCKETSDAFTELANECASHQAGANTKKKATRAVGGTASAVLLGGGVAASAVAGALTLGIGAIVGLSLTAAALAVTGLGTATATGITASHYSKAENAFESASKIFQELANYGIDLQSHFDDIHVVVTRFKTNQVFIVSTDQGDLDTMCGALDKLKAILHSEQAQTSKARKSLRTFKQTITV